MQTQQSPNQLISGLILVAGLVVLVACFPLRGSNDPWWHLKAGVMQLQGQLGWYDNDPFSVSGAHEVWVNHEWFGQILFALAWVYGGFHGAIVFKAVLLAVAFGIVYWQGMRRSSARWALLTTLLAIPASQYTMYLRPPVYTFLLLPIWLHLLEKWLAEARDHGRSACKFLGWLALVMVIWCNLHGGALLGVVLAGWTALCLVGDRFARWGLRRTGTGILTAGVMMSVVSLAALMNPWGWRTYWLTWVVMSDPIIPFVNFELAPPAWQFTWAYNLMLGATLLLLIVIWNKLSLFETGVVLFLAHQSSQHVRHLPLFALATAPVLAYQLNLLETRLSRFHHRTPYLFRVLAWTLAITAIAMTVQLGDRPRRFLAFWQGPGWVPDCEPVMLGELLASESGHAPFLCPNTRGGYLIWRLAPEIRRIFTDNRYDHHGSQPLLVEETIMAGHDMPAYAWAQEFVPELLKNHPCTQTPAWLWLCEHYAIEWVIWEAPDHTPATRWAAESAPEVEYYTHEDILVGNRAKRLYLYRIHAHNPAERQANSGYSP